LRRWPLLGGDAHATQRLIHLRGKATPGRICAVGSCVLRRRQLTARCSIALRNSTKMITHHRVTVIVNG
jgi:hypothetical protein